MVGSARGEIVKSLAKTLSVDVFHDEEEASILADDVVNADNVRVLKPSKRIRLIPEPGHDNGVRGDLFLEDFYRNFTLKLRVDCQPDLGHSPLGKVATEFVPPPDEGIRLESRNHVWSATLVARLLWNAECNSDGALASVSANHCTNVTDDDVTGVKLANFGDELLGIWALRLKDCETFGRRM